MKNVPVDGRAQRSVSANSWDEVFGESSRFSVERKQARRNRPERKAKHRPGAGSSEATSVVAVFCERFSLMAPSRPGAEPCLEPTGRMARRKILGAQRYTRARVSSSAHPLFIVMRLLHFVGSFCTGWYSGAKAISRVVSSSRAAGVRTTPARIGSSPVWKYQHASIAASSASTVVVWALHSRGNRVGCDVERSTEPETRHTQATTLGQRIG